MLGKEERTNNARVMKQQSVAASQLRQKHLKHNGKKPNLTNRSSKPSSHHNKTLKSSSSQSSSSSLSELNAAGGVSSSLERLSAPVKRKGLHEGKSGLSGLLELLGLLGSGKKHYIYDTGSCVFMHENTRTWVETDLVYIYI